MDPNNTQQNTPPPFNQQILPTMQGNKESSISHKPFFVWSILVLVAIFLCVGMVLFLFLGKRNVSTPVASENAGVPTARVTDLAPSLPANQKTIILIQDSDSSFEKIILPTIQVEAYIKSLPEGEKVISQMQDR